jgi:hypothetical protein
VDGPDPRPLWFANWGTEHGSDPSSLKRALDRVLAERGQEGYAKFKHRLRLSSDDQFGEHTTARAPPFDFWVDTFRPERDRRRWYHRFSALTATAGGFDVERDLRRDHGPLGALYPTNTTHPQKEGDTMTFLYLVPTGMNDPNEPGWGCWAGRYGLREGAAGRPYYWASEEDEWQGRRDRDNTVRRWAADLQNDFRARLDWCVKPPGEANHRPAAVVNGSAGPEILRLEAPAGSKLDLSATGSTDPDRDALVYEWFPYPEAGTFPGPVKIEGAAGERARAAIPAEAEGKTIHLILRLLDRGSPPLAAYRRVVVKVTAPRGW